MFSSRGPNSTSIGSNNPSSLPCAAGSVGDPSGAAYECTPSNGVAPSDPDSAGPASIDPPGVRIGNPYGHNSTSHGRTEVIGAESSSLVQQVAASAVPPRTPATRRSIEQPTTRSPTTAASGASGSGAPTPRSGAAGSKSPTAAAVGGSLATSIGLIVGCVAAIVFLLFGLGFGVYKYRSRDEGVYRIDDVKNYFSPANVGGSGRNCNSGAANGGGTLTGNSSVGYEACNSKPMVHLDGGSGSVERSKSKSRSRSSSSVSAQSASVVGRTKRKENREWYV